MKNGILGALALAVGCMFSAPQAAQAADITFGHVLKEDSWYHQVAVEFERLVEERTSGAVTVSIFPNGQLGGEAKMIQGARVGSIGVGIAATPIFETIAPEYAVLSLPYLFESAELADQKLGSDAGVKMLELLDKRGIIGLGFFSAVERNVFGKKPVRTVSDLKGVKVRVPQTPSFVEAYDAMGAQATPMAYTELYLALQNGVIDMAETSPDVFVSDRFTEVSGYFNRTHVHISAPILFMSKVLFDRLTPEQQQIVRQSASDALQLGKDAYVKITADSYDAMKASGIEVIQTDNSGLAEVGRGVWPSLLSQITDGKTYLALFQ